MTATLASHKPRNPLVAVQATMLIALLLSPALIKVQLDRAAYAEVANEYQSGRTFILSKIETAVEGHDVKTLLHLRGKYAGSVTDHKFKEVLDHALAKVTAREIEMGLAVSKRLDLQRQRETPGSRNTIEAPTQKPQIAIQQRLSQLPR